MLSPCIPKKRNVSKPNTKKSLSLILCPILILNMILILTQDPVYSFPWIFTVTHFFFFFTEEYLEPCLCFTWHECTTDICVHVLYVLDTHSRIGLDGTFDRTLAQFCVVKAIMVKIVILWKISVFNFILYII